MPTTLVVAVVLALMLGPWAEYALLSPGKVALEKQTKTWWVRKVDNVDFDFILEQEGFKLKGYVPEPEKSESGVTIASGFDLGARNLNDLKGLPQDIIDLLKPYLGLKKKAAEDKLKEKPLNVSKDQAKTINKFVKKKSLAQLSKAWKAKTGQEFSTLSKEKATVVASVAFQYGNLETETKNFWQQVTSGDWDGAYKNLLNFGDDYTSRRKREAEYLKPDLTEKKAEAPKIQAQPYANEETQEQFLDIVANNSIVDNDHFFKQLDTEIGLEKLGGPWRRLSGSISADTKLGTFSAGAEQVFSEEGDTMPEAFSLEYKNGGFSASMYKQDEYEKMKLNFRKKF